MRWSSEILFRTGRLIERFRAAADEFSGDARASELPKHVEHLYRVERDMLGVPETEIEPPPWIGAPQPAHFVAITAGP